MDIKLSRCFWADGDPLMARYHDEEWGTPVHDDFVLFEYMVLDGFQAGLSWLTILKKREHFRRAFDDFDPELVARYADRERERLLADPGIVRNRAKVDATIQNARLFLEVQKEIGTFDQYIWQFTDGKPIRQPGGVTRETLRCASPESDAMSKALRKRGFRFVGSTICYAFMQAAGMVNDHLDGCFKAPGANG